MRLIRLLQGVGAAFVAGAWASASLDAQTGRVSPTSRWALGVSGDIGEVATPYAAGCGDATSIGGGPGAGLLFRPGRWLTLEADTRAVFQPSGCKTLLIFVPVARDTTYLSPNGSLVQSEVRLGIETPSTLPLLRASVGLGRFWEGRPAPVGSLALGVGTRGERLRYHAELETFMSRTRAVEHVYQYNAAHAPVGSTDSMLTLHPHWWTLHLGIELPLFT